MSTLIPSPMARNSRHLLHAAPHLYRLVRAIRLLKFKLLLNDKLVILVYLAYIKVFKHCYAWIKTAICPNLRVFGMTLQYVPIKLETCYMVEIIGYKFKIQMPFISSLMVAQCNFKCITNFEKLLRNCGRKSQ